MKKVLTVLILMLLAATLLFAQNKLVMGVYLHDMYQKDYDELGIKDNCGVKIDVLVKEGPADVAGLMPDDVILKIDGEKVRTTNQVSKMFYAKKKGQKIDVEILRDGIKKTFSISLMEKEYHRKPYMGVYLANISKEKYAELEVSENRGILIKKVVDDTPAEKAGLQSKDVLIMFDGEKIYSEGQLSKILREHTIGESVKLQVIRDGKLKKLKIKLGDRDDGKTEVKIKS